MNLGKHEAIGNSLCSLFPGKESPSNSCVGCDRDPRYKHIIALLQYFTCPIEVICILSSRNLHGELHFLLSYTFGFLYLQAVIVMEGSKNYTPFCLFYGGGKRFLCFLSGLQVGKPVRSMLSLLATGFYSGVNWCLKNSQLRKQKHFTRLVKLE